MLINMGSADRKLRALVAAPVLIVAGVLVGPAGWLSIVLYAMAGVMLASQYNERKTAAGFALALPWVFSLSRHWSAFAIQTADQV